MHGLEGRSLHNTNVNISAILDNCYACDPRLKKFREEEKERKVAEKKAKEEAARLAAEEQEKVA